MSKIVFNEEYPWEKGFADIFHKNIEGILLNAEMARRMIFFFLFLTFFSMFVVLLEIPALHDAGIEYRSIAIKCAFVFMIAFFVTIRFYKFYGKRVKNKILPHITSFFNKDLQYFGKGNDFVNPKEISVFHTFDDYESDDTFLLKNAKYPYAISEISLIKLIETDKGIVRKKKFRGLVLNIIAKNLPLIIVKERAAIISDEVFQKHARFHIEDPVFENIYDSYCDDQLAARKIFKPKVIEAILRFGILCQNISKKTNSLKNIIHNDYASLRRDFAPRFLFNSNGLMLIIPCKKDLFEPTKFFANAAKSDDVKLVLYQLHLVSELIKTLEEQILGK